MKNYPRLGGFVLSFFSFGVSFWVWNQTLEEARQGKDEVSLSYGFATLVTFGFVFLALMILGPGMQQYSKGLQGRKKTPLDIALILLFLLPGLAAWLLLKARIEQLGYSFAPE